MNVARINVAIPHAQRGLVDSYIMEEPKNVPAILDFRRFENYAEYMRMCRKGQRAAASKAKRLGYICKACAEIDYVKDVVAINHSMGVRSGGGMRNQYLYDEEQYRELIKGSWDGIYKGVFRDGQLYGYVHYRGFGRFGYYSRFLGHGDHLKNGIMPLLHFYMVDFLWYCVDYLMYGAWDSGKGTSLQDWKRRMLFEPCLLIAKR